MTEMTDLFSLKYYIATAKRSLFSQSVFQNIINQIMSHMYVKSNNQVKALTNEKTI